MKLYLIGGDVVPFAELYLGLTYAILLSLLVLWRQDRRVVAASIIGLVAFSVVIAPWGHNCDDWPWWFALMMGCIGW